MSIYYTTWDRIEDTGQLYKEWVGKCPEFKGIRVNVHLIIACEEKTNKIVGAAQLIIIDDPIWDRSWGLVENVYVDKAYRKCGIGSNLMWSLEEQASILGCKFIKLTTRKKEGKELYRSLGYEEGSSFRKELK